MSQAILLKTPEKLVKVGSDEWIDHYESRTYMHDDVEDKYFLTIEHEILNTRNPKKSTSWEETNEISFSQLPKSIQNSIKCT
jgi:hypothetical protein